MEWLWDALIQPQSPPGVLVLVWYNVSITSTWFSTPSNPIQLQTVTQLALCLSVPIIVQSDRASLHWVGIHIFLLGKCQGNVRETTTCIGIFSHKLFQGNPMLLWDLFFISWPVKLQNSLFLNEQGSYKNSFKFLGQSHCKILQKFIIKKTI